MNESTPSPISQRSETLSFFRWLFTWRGLRRVLIVLAWTATIIAALYGEENWRGRRLWQNYRRQLEAGGAQLDLKAFIPKPIPAEQNFGAIPFVQSWFTQRTNMEQRWKDNYSQIEGRISSLGLGKKARWRRAVRKRSRTAAARKVR